ncbi:hypothetical protein L7F22_008677 [Adiantum nelumboides]|nr:hypothetical protein [Adiantum nelumboides]
MSAPELFAGREQPDTLCLFDVDETLTPARNAVSPEMMDLLTAIKTKKCAIGFVGGSDLAKIRGQLQLPGLPDATDFFDYGFAENGLIAYRAGKVLASQSFIGWLGEEKYKTMVKFILGYISQLDLPIMRSAFRDFGLTFSIGGMISFDVFPSGWDKTFALRHVEKDGFKTIHFFGDKTYKGGNDYEIFSDERTVGHSVANPQDTMVQLRKLFDL